MTSASALGFIVQTLAQQHAPPAAGTAPGGVVAIMASITVVEGMPRAGLPRPLPRG